MQDHPILLLYSETENIAMMDVLHSIHLSYHHCSIGVFSFMHDTNLTVTEVAFIFTSTSVNKYLCAGLKSV